MVERSHSVLRDIVAVRQHSGEQVVFTNGVFDILHVGHLRYLAEARALGDALVVAVNSDASVRRLKGDKRPISPEAERVELLDGLRCVDYVTIFETDTPEPLVELVKPNIYAKGGDYTVDRLPEAKVVQAYGGQVRILSLIQGRSSTDIVRTILSRYCEPSAGV